MMSSLTGEQWVHRYANAHAVFADNWVVIFSSNDEADRFLKYVNKKN